MARADLLLDLVEAERRGDRDRFRVLVEAVIAEAFGAVDSQVEDWPRGRTAELVRRRYGRADWNRQR